MYDNGTHGLIICALTAVRIVDVDTYVWHASYARKHGALGHTAVRTFVASDRRFARVTLREPAALVRDGA